MVTNLKVAEQSFLKREFNPKEEIKQTAVWSNGMGVCPGSGRQHYIDMKKKQVSG